MPSVGAITGAPVPGNVGVVDLDTAEVKAWKALACPAAEETPAEEPAADAAPAEEPSGE